MSYHKAAKLIGLSLLPVVLLICVSCASSTPTPYPTYTPYPISTSYPTYTPYPESTSYPTYTPSPISTPYPTYTPYPALFVALSAGDMGYTLNPSLLGYIALAFCLSLVLGVLSVWLVIGKSKTYIRLVYGCIYLVALVILVAPILMQGIFIIVMSIIAGGAGFLVGAFSYKEQLKREVKRTYEFEQQLAKDNATTYECEILEKTKPIMSQIEINLRHSALSQDKKKEILNRSQDILRKMRNVIDRIGRTRAITLMIDKSVAKKEDRDRIIKRNLAVEEKLLDALRSSLDTLAPIPTSLVEYETSRDDNKISTLMAHLKEMDLQLKDKTAEWQEMKT